MWCNSCGSPAWSRGWPYTCRQLFQYAGVHFLQRMNEFIQYKPMHLCFVAAVLICPVCPVICPVCTHHLAGGFV